METGWHLAFVFEPNIEGEDMEDSGGPKMVKSSQHKTFQKVYFQTLSCSMFVGLLMNLEVLSLMLSST